MTHSTTIELPHIKISYRLEMKHMGHCMTHLWVSRDATMSFSRSHNFCIYAHPLLIYLASSSYNQLTNTMRTTMSLSQPTALARAFKIPLNTTFQESAYPHIKFPMQHSYTKYLGDKKKASTVFDPKNCGSTNASLIAVSLSFNC